MLDGFRLIEDITYADSMGHEILAINDGSYIVIEDGRTELFGEAYRILDGEEELICRDGESRSVSEIVLKMRREIADRSRSFEEQTKGTVDEYNIYREHIRYVYKYVVSLSEGKNVDREVLELSALLHDIAMTDRSLDRSRHNEFGAEIAAELLRKNGCPDEKTEHVKKCILNHSSKRAEYRTSAEEQLLVDADGLSHFDSYKSLYSLAHKVMGINDEDSLKFIRDKLTRDYEELSDDLKDLVSEKYAMIMKAGTVREILE
jgi:HD superfamily phosphodiesterase